MRKKWHRYFALIGIAVFVYILSRIDFKSFLSLLSQANYSFFGLLPFSIFLVFLIQTLKWRLLLKIQGLDYDFWYLFKVHIVSEYYGLLTPGRVGYFIKISYLDKPFGEASASVIVDKILDFFCLMVFSIAGSFLLAGRFPNFITQISLLVFVFVVLVLFFYSKARAKFLFGFFKKITPAKFHNPLKTIFHNFYDNLPSRRKLLVPLLLTFFVWFLIYSQTYLIAQAFNIKISFWYFIFCFPIATIIGLIPITISGLGTREAALILLFSQFNIPIESIVVLSISSLILVSYLPAVFGAFLSLKLKNANASNTNK